MKVCQLTRVVPSSVPAVAATRAAAGCPAYPRTGGSLTRFSGGAILTSRSQWNNRRPRRRVVEGRSVHEARDGVGRRRRHARARSRALRRCRPRSWRLCRHSGSLWSIRRGSSGWSCSRRCRCSRGWRRRTGASRSSWWHWWFFAQLGKPAEVFINANPDAWYAVTPEQMGEQAYVDLRRALRDPEKNDESDDARSAKVLQRRHFAPPDLNTPSSPRLSTDNTKRRFAGLLKPLSRTRRWPGRHPAPHRPRRHRSPRGR